MNTNIQPQQHNPPVADLLAIDAGVTEQEGPIGSARQGAESVGHSKTLRPLPGTT